MLIPVVIIFDIKMNNFYQLLILEFETKKDLFGLTIKNRIMEGASLPKVEKRQKFIHDGI